MDRRKELGIRLGVQDVDQHKKYLGFPTLIGKRVIQNMKEWKEKSISLAGKEVFLKSVIQSIPTYAMSCSLFLITLCQKIERASSQFFWGSTIEDRKNHWAAWDVLTTSKAKGGIGFRELHLFNLAMLARQWWNLLQNQKLIIFQILKAKYFRRSSLSQAHLEYRSSYLWRSWLDTRELVQHGMAWRVGRYSRRPMYWD